MKRGQAIGAVDHFMETFNWCTQWTANIEAGDGIKFQNKDSDHPTISADIIAGKGIVVSEYNGALKISLEEDDDDDDGGENGNSPNRKSGGGKSGGSSNGSGKASGTGSGSGSGTGAGSGSGSGYGGGSGNSSGGGSGGGSSGTDNGDGTNCNRYSGDLVNDNSDAGLDNGGDNCDELNGW